MGESRGSDVFYNWRWYYNTPGLGLWIVLVIGLIVIKENRTPRILFIFVPFLILSVLWFLITQMMNFSSSADIVTFNMMFNSLAAGIALLWLFTPELGRLNPWFAFFLSMILIMMFFLVGIVSYHGFGFSQDTIVVLTMLVVLALAMLFGFILAGWRCRKRYGPVRFMLWLAIWMVIICVISILVFYMIAFAVERAPIPISTILIMATTVGLVLGICLYLINLPYMILALSNSFFRERLLACLRLRPIPVVSEQPDIGRPNEQNSGKEMSEKGDFV